MKGLQRRGKKWGYDVVRGGERHARFSWSRREEAAKALRKLLADLDNKPKIPRNALLTVINQFLIESAQAGRSSHRLIGMRYVFERVIIPYFGAARDFTTIATDDVSQFILDMKAKPIVVHGAIDDKGKRKPLSERPRTNSTIWHYVTDLRALYNWACRRSPEKRLAELNPVDFANLDPIKRRKHIKPPLDPAVIDDAAEVLPLKDRVYYDFVRYTGSRKDEANRVEWGKHLCLDDRDNALYLVPGTKTEEAAEYLPLHPHIVDELRAWRQVCPSEVYVFPGNSSQTKSKKIYSRSAMLKILRRHGYHITVKDLRDWFITQVCASTRDPAVVMKLARHKSLQTTTKYIRTVRDRMRDAVNAIVTSRCDFASIQGQKIPQQGHNAALEAEQENAATSSYEWEKRGGGGQIRTVDAADMSRVDRGTRH